MEKKRIHTNNAPAAVGPYSQAIRVGDYVFTAGQVALDPTTGELVGADVATQTEQVMSNLRAVLAAAGSGLGQVIKTTVFLQSMGDFAAMNAVYAEFFGDAKPARTTIECKFADARMLVEIDCIAYVG